MWERGAEESIWTTEDGKEKCQRGLHNEEFYSVCASSERLLQGEKLKENEVAGEYSTLVKYEKCVFNGSA